MSRIRRILFTIIFFIFLFSVAPSALALDFGSGEVQKAADTAGFDPGTTETTFAETTGTVIAMILSFTGVIFLVLMVYAGWLWMTARGEEEPVEKAQKIIISSIIGLIILVGAYSITSFVVPRMTDVTGKDENEESVCCQVCPKSEPEKCEYTETSAEICQSQCAYGQLGPEGKVCNGEPMTNLSGDCSSNNWPD